MVIRHPPRAEGSSVLADDDLKDFFDNADLPFHWVGYDGTILAANRAELALLGYTEEEYIGRNIASFHADERVIADILQRLKAGETLRDYPAVLRCRDGSLKEVRITSSVLRRNGKFIHTRCLTRDVTGMREIERRAFHLSAVVSSSDDAIVSKTLDGIVESWNDAAERLFGYTAQEMVGQSIRRIIPEDRQTEEDEVLRRIRRGERIDHFQTQRRRKDGTLVPISLTVSPVKDSHGRIIGASKIARDISAQVAAEEARREAMATKDRFIGLISHELRTPLTVIVGNAQLLLRRRGRLAESASVQALTDLAGQGQRLLHVIENLLLLTRVNDGGSVTLTDVDLVPLCERILADVRQQFGPRTVRSAYPFHSAHVASDPALLALILENLLSNAHKYSPPHLPIDLELREATDAAGTRALEVHVLDHGPGIDSAASAHIFEPFFRGEATALTSPGMGLGLTVCRVAAEALGGHIQAAPRPQGGSDFWLSIPCRVAPSGDLTHAPSGTGRGR